MKIIKLIILILVAMQTSIHAQDYKIANTTINFYDSERNRNIETHIFYPADISGANKEIAKGEYPVIIFAHGFVMNWESYENFWNELVPKAYIVCFPSTESGLTPSHKDFAEDLSFLANQLQVENANIDSPFYNSVLPKTILMGHSMGGGAAYLAAESNSNIQAIVTFAAAETNPSAKESAENINVPALLFSGDDDCVAPPEEHQTPIYQSLASDCKTHISIIDGGHCYFANDNFFCTLGESSCNPVLEISRKDQQRITFSFLNNWLKYIVKDDQKAFNDFANSLKNSNEISYSQYCNSSSVEENNPKEQIRIYPNPASTYITIESDKYLNSEYKILNYLGKEVKSGFLSGKIFKIKISEYTTGTYFIMVNAKVLKLIKL